jgi:putative ABC transport system permease protein
MGGLLGIALGIAASELVPRFLGWPTAVSSGSIVVSFAAAVAIGVFFGFYPARKASELDPIEALRYE